MSAMLKYISAAVRDWRWKSGRCGESGGGDRDAQESEDGVESDGYRYSRTEIGDAQVGERSCVAAQ